jgi:KipI family sensor histidine kinase inhibitor
VSLEPARLKAAGDSAVVVEFGDAIDLAVNRRVHALAHLLAGQAMPGVTECVPTYRSLLVRYDPLTLDFETLLAWLQSMLGRVDSVGPSASRRVDVPTFYGGEHGPDLAWVAARCGLAVEEVVRRHSLVDYTVYMMGFTPGYPYMGTLDPSLAVPRLESPRQRVRAGSVGIAGLQTGIYPIDSPGGWRLIGWTPLVLFDASREPPFLFQPGDSVRFVPHDARP